MIDQTPSGKYVIIGEPKVHKSLADLVTYHQRVCLTFFYDLFFIQVNLDMTDSMGPGKLVRHMQNLSYTYDTYLICMGL